MLGTFAAGFSLRHGFADSPVAPMTLMITLETAFGEMIATAGGYAPALFA